MPRAQRPGSHTCGHPNKYKRRGQRRHGTCCHRVSDDSGYRYCEDHRDGLREFWATTVKPALRRERRSAEGPIRNEGWERVPGAVRDGAVAQAREIATDQWIRRSRQRVDTALGAQIAQQARARSGSALCRELATVAEALAVGQRWAVRAVEDAATPVFGWFGRPKLARLVAQQFAKCLPIAAGVEVMPVVHALRAYGVLICVVGGRDLARCHCLRQIAGSVTPAQVRREVREIVGEGLVPLA